MKIGLIALSGVRVRTRELAELGVTLPGFIRRGKVIASLPSLGLLTIAGLTPPAHEVEYIEIDEWKEHLTLPHFDLVGISSLTARIDTAYRVADFYRKQQTKVIMGGLHVSKMPEEALEHADAIVIGGAESVWEKILQDVESNRLEKIYRGATDFVFRGSNYATPRFNLLSGRNYNRITVQTSRGCPRSCEFCGASLMITRRFNQKPVELVLSEIREAKKWIDHPFFEFADDNTFLNKTWSKAFLRELIREEITYFTETDASVTEDPELCDLIAKSGCKQLLIGFESPQSDDLKGIDPCDWKKKQSGRLLRVINTLQSRGISVNGCFILGLDNHTPDIFPNMLEFVKASGLAEVQYTVLTPFPGTALYRRLKHENRLLQERFWSNCTLFDVNFHPLKMTREELESGLAWLLTQTYSANSTRERLRNFITQKHGN